MMLKQIKRYRFFLSIVAVSMVAAFFDPEFVRLSVRNSTGFLLEILSILPPVLVIIALLDVWVPRKVVEKHLGPESGVRGAALAVLLGTAAAGPLYAAFPLALSLRQKGVRTANITIFLGTWAAIKIPMILMESTFIGIRFALLRLAFTLPGVLLMGYGMEFFFPAAPLSDTEVFG